jgi:multiple sugar transport system substrate-binding protein
LRNPEVFVSQSAATRRRLLRRGAALAMLTPSLLAACGGAGSGENTGSGGAIKAQTGTIAWHLWSAQPEHLEQYQAISKAFQDQQSQVKLDMVVPASDSTAGGYFDRLKTQIAGGQPVDVIGASPVWVPDVAANGLGHELTSFVNRDKQFKLDDYAKGVVDAGSWKGKLYFLTLFGNFNVLYYNKALFDKAGVKYPDENWTLDTMLDAAKRITQRTGDPNTDVYGMDFNRDLNQVSPYLWAFGGEPFDKPEEPTKGTMSAAATLEGFSWLVDAINKVKVAPGEAGAARPGFTTGRLGMITQGVNSFAATAKSQVTWDIAPLPKGKAGRPNFAGTLFYGMGAGTKLPDAAWTFVKFLCGADGQGRFVRTQIGAPVLKGLEKDYLNLPPPPVNRKVVIDSLPNLKALPKTLHMMDIYDPVFTKNMADAFAGKVSPGEAAKQIDDQVAAILAKK